MKNIDCDKWDCPVMTGPNWVATPFCMNYGFDNHRYEDDYIESIYENNSLVELNLFEKEDWRYHNEHIVKYSKRSSFARSFVLGDFKEALLGAVVKEYNTMHLLFIDDKVKICASWLAYNQNKSIGDAMLGTNTTTSDYLLTSVKTFVGYTTPTPKLITFDIRQFKGTSALYIERLCLRLTKDFLVSGKQSYDDFVRLDEGDNGRGYIEQFSTIKTVNLPEEIVYMCIKQIEVLQFEDWGGDYE